MNSQNWYTGKGQSLVTEVLSCIFSLAFPKAILSSFGYYLHEHVLWRKRIHVDGHCRIHARASIRNPQNVYLGDNVRITMDCCIWAGESSRITIGKDVLVGPGAKMFSANHGTSLGAPMTSQQRTEADITIDDDVWIGANTIILKGVHVHRGAIVAAGAVVVHDVPEDTIVGGVPARTVGTKKPQQQ